MEKNSHPIICGTDFSETAMEAANVAAALARKLRVQLILVHVEEFRGLAMSDPGLFESVIAGKREELTREANRLRSMETAVEELFPSGSVFEELIGAATKAKARLLVVGAVGHGLARRLFVGSVAERVAETSPVPTLVVRPGCALGAWAMGGRNLQVLAGYDFSNAGDAAVRWLAGLLEIGPCEINITHVDWPPEQANRFGYHGPLTLNANPVQIQSFLERDLRERVDLNLAPDHVSLSVVSGWGRTDAHLLQIALGFTETLPVSVAVVPTAAVGPKQITVPVLDRVLVATDFSDLGNDAVRYACAILRRGGVLKLLHVLDRGEPTPKLIGQLRGLVPPSVARQFKVEAEVIERGSASEAISQAAERCDAEVICLGSHGRTGLAKTLLGSVAQGVLAQSKRPVLIIRPRD